MHRHLIWILISLLPTLGNGQSNVPASNSSLKPAFEGRVFKREADVDYLAEVLWREENHNSYKSIGLSARKILPWQYTIGAYLNHSWGERYGDSWSKNLNDNQWRWVNVDGVGEFKLGMLAQKKWSLSESVSAEFRVSLENRFKVQKLFAAFRPGINYQFASQWMSYLRYEAYMLLENSPATFYKQGIYLGVLNASFKSVLLGPFIRFEKHEWWTSNSFKQITGGDYRSHDELVNIGLTLIYSL